MITRLVLLALVFTLTVAVIWCWAVTSALCYNDNWWTPPGPDDPPPNVVIWQK